MQKQQFFCKKMPISVKITILLFLRFYPNFVRACSLYSYPRFRSLDKEGQLSRGYTAAEVVEVGIILQCDESVLADIAQCSLEQKHKKNL